jgi:LPXTG-motif cell wall-anchored protein
MRRGLSTALAVAALLNLWALSAGPLAQEPPAPLKIAAGPAEVGKDLHLSVAPAPAGAVRYEWRVAGATMQSQQPRLVTRLSQPGPVSIEVNAFDAGNANVGEGRLTVTPAAAPAPKSKGGHLIGSTSTGDAKQKPRRRAPRAHRVKAAASSSVAIKDFSFGPSSITVHVGDTVTWVNNGPTDHTATANNGSFDTGTLKKGQSGSHTFSSAGSFSYICSLHPFMKGTVVVAAGAGGSAPQSSGTGSGSTPSTSTPRAGVTPQRGGLPNTGVDIAPLLLSGVLLLGSGLLLRRRLT